MPHDDLRQIRLKLGGECGVLRRRTAKKTENWKICLEGECGVLRRPSAKKTGNSNIGLGGGSVGSLRPLRQRRLKIGRSVYSRGGVWRLQATYGKED